MGAYDKLIGQGTRMTQIIPNDLAPVAFPGNLKTSGTGDNPGSGVATTLDDATAKFLTTVKEGDIIYATKPGIGVRGGSVVKKVVSNSQLLTDTVVNADFGSNGVAYEIYRNAVTPFRLWIIQADKSVTIETAGGDLVFLESAAFSGGAFINYWEGPQCIGIKESGSFSAGETLHHWAIW